MPKKPKLTPEQRSKIIELSDQGLSVPEIAAQMAIEGSRVNGVVNTARNRGVLHKPTPIPQTETPQMNDLGASPPPVQPHPVAPPPAAPMSVPTAPPASPARPQFSPPQDPDGQAWRPAVAGQGEGFMHPLQKVEYKIERVSPRDGVLGMQSENLTDDELGQIYGEGHYRVWKHEGNRPPVYRDVMLSKAYGEPRFPRPASQTPDGRRPANRFPEGGDEGSHLPPRPRLAPNMYGLNERAGLPPFPRPAPSNDLAAVALSKLSESHEKALDRMAQGAATAGAPAESMKEFFKEQQALAERRATEEAQRRETERQREREEARQREQDRETQHRRDMERIKAENDARIQADREARQGLLDIEKARMEVIKEEARSREAAMKAELEKIRVESREERQSLLEKMAAIEKRASEAIESAQEDLQEELEKGRLSLTREFDLKEKHLDAESKLKEDLLKLREEMLKNQNGDETSKMIGKLVEGLERTVKEVVDLKKIEAATAESHLSKVGERGAETKPGLDGGAPSSQPPSAPGLPAPTDQSAAMRNPGENGNGHGETAEQKKELQSMDNFVRQMSQDPFFQEVLTEWGKHVKAEANATTFTNMFMEWMKDDGTPEGARARKACAAFVNHMQIRGWEEIYALIEPAIPAAYRENFKTPHAAEFYAQFRLMVVSSVDDYWKAYIAAKQAEQQAAQQAKQDAVKSTPQRVSASPASA